MRLLAFIGFLALVLGIAALVFFFVLVSTSAGLVFGTLLRSEDQAITIAAPVGIALAMLGGCMWSLEIVGSRSASGNPGTARRSGAMKRRSSFPSR